MGPSGTTGASRAKLTSSILKSPATQPRLAEKMITPKKLTSFAESAPNKREEIHLSPVAQEFKELTVVQGDGEEHANISTEEMY